MGKNKYIKIGTILKIIYNNGYKVEQECILANTFDKQELFQVIVIKGYHCGEIDGYISRQFDDERRNCCTYAHLEKQLKERVYESIVSIDYIDQKTING